MNKLIKILLLTLILFLTCKFTVIACGPGFPEYIYDSSQILTDYYPLISGVGSTDIKKIPILNQNFEVIAPLWGPEYMLPVYLASKNKQFPDNLKTAWVTSVKDPDKYPITGFYGKEYNTYKSIKDWMEVRNKYSKIDSTDAENLLKDYPFYIDKATDIRFQTATKKLIDLGKRFNQGELAQWINYQDQMFGMYFTSSPLPVTLSSPNSWQIFVLSIKKLLKINITEKYLPSEMVQENEYQLAAIEYYKENYDKAIEMFNNIYSNKNNVRHNDAALSLGWSYISKANQKHESDLKAESKDAEKNYIESLKIAQSYYEKILTDSSLSDVKLEIDKYFDYVLYRTDPVARLVRAGKIILTTNDQDEFLRNQDDYINLWYKYFYNQIGNKKDVPEYQQYSKKIKESGDEFSQFLLAWMDLKSYSLDENINKYKETQSALWLIVAQRQVSPDNQQWSYINNEINKINSDSPFYLTAQYYNLSSQSSDPKLKETIKEPIKKLIAQSEKNKQYNTQNLFNNLMFNLSDNLMEKQKYSMMNYLNLYSTWFEQTSWVPYYQYLDFETKDREFFISKEMKQTLASTDLDKLNDLLSNENIFTPKIKQYLRLLLFTKATVENRLDISKNIAVLLAKNNSIISVDLSAFIKSKNIEEQKYLAARFILNYPGVTDLSNDNFDEFLLGSVSDIKTIDNFKRNWDISLEDVVVQNTDKMQNKIGEAVDKIIIDFASNNPKYQSVPESLSQLVDFAHFGPGTSGQKAFQLLHTNYPSSTWAKQTPYWYE